MDWNENKIVELKHKGGLYKTDDKDTELIFSVTYITDDIYTIFVVCHSDGTRTVKDYDDILEIVSRPYTEEELKYSKKCGGFV